MGAAVKYLDKRAQKKQWIQDITDFRMKRVSIIGANGSAKSTYTFRMFARLCWRRPGIFLITSGTSDQASKLYNQKLKTIITKMGLVKENNVKMIYELANGSEIHIKSGESFQTVEGIEYDFWFADEFQDHSQEAAELFLKRTRRSRQNSIVRITGLPEDPDSWQYEFLEKNNFTLHEISLYDHPDPEWIEYYEGVLKELFTGAKLKRYLNGERVTLTGINLFSANQDHRINAEYDPQKELYLDWDFNVEYRAVTAWQESHKEEVVVTGHRLTLPVMNCIESFQMKNYTTVEDAKELCNYYKAQKARIFLHGDASGENRSAQTSDSMWNQIRTVFNKEFPNNVRDVIPRSNPNVKDTIQVTNWALSKGLLHFSDKAKTAYRYLVAAKADKYGEIDKSNDYKEGGAKSHEVDTIRYLAHYIYEKYFPGAETKTISKKKLLGF